MRVLCLTDYPMRPVGHRWIWEHVSQQDDEVDFLSIRPKDRSARWGKVLTRYPAYFQLAVRALGQMARNPYDLVVAWESKVGVPIGLVRWIAGRNLPPLVIFAFAPGYVPSQLLPLVRLALKKVDHVTVLSRAEMASYGRLLGLSRRKMSLCRLGAYDVRDAARRIPPLSRVPYIHSSGRTARDFRTLVAAVRGLDVELVLHGRDYDLRGLSLPPNVRTGDLVPKEEFAQLVLHSLFEVVALKHNVYHPAGSSQVVYAMMMGKAVVCTRTPPLEEYVEHGTTGLLVEPGSADDMRSALLHLLENPGEAARMGQNARQKYEECYTFERFARASYEILRQVVSS